MEQKKLSRAVFLAPVSSAVVLYAATWGAFWVGADSEPRFFVAAGLVIAGVIGAAFVGIRLNRRYATKVGSWFIAASVFGPIAAVSTVLVLLANSGLN